MKRAKVAFFITDLDAGGAETALVSLIRALDKHRFEPCVVSLRSGGRLAAELSGCVPALWEMGAERPSTWLGATMRLRRPLSEWRPVVVVGWMYHGCLAASYFNLLCQLRASVVWSLHHNPQDLSSEKVRTRALIRTLCHLAPRPSVTLYVSPASLRNHLAIGYPAENAFVVPPGADTTRFRPNSEARRSLRLELSIPADAPVIGMAARLHPVKRYPLFLDAARLLSRWRTDVHFLVAGRGAGTGELEEEIRRRDLGGRVHALGDRTDMPRIYAAWDVATCCSRMEALPLSVCEAMSCGVPPVVTSIGDLPTLAAGCGLCVPPEDPEALARAWSALLDLGVSGRAVLGARARSKIVKDYSAQTFAHSYEKVFQELAGLPALPPEQAPPRAAALAAPDNLSRTITHD